VQVGLNLDVHPTATVPIQLSSCNQITIVGKKNAQENSASKGTYIQVKTEKIKILRTEYWHRDPSSSLGGKGSGTPL